MFLVTALTVLRVAVLMRHNYNSGMKKTIVNLRRFRALQPISAIVISSCLLACQPDSTATSPTSAKSGAAAVASVKAELDLSPLQSSLQQIAQLGSFDEDQLEELLAQHNKKQPQVASDQQDNPDWVLYDVGAQVLSLEQVGDTSFTVLWRKVVEAHSAGVDVGSDELFTLIFNKQTRELQRAIAGKLENWHTDGLQIVAGQRETCLGVNVPQQFSVIDLKQAGKTILSQSLDAKQSEASLYRVEVKSRGQLDFITTSDQKYTGKAELTKTCDVGDWMDKLETTYSVTCDEQQVCKISKQTKRFAGCQEIGSCD